MNKLDDRGELLATVRAVRGDMERIVADAEEDVATRGGTFDAWAFKDIVAHLTGWRWRTVVRLEAALDGREPIMPWPAPLDEGDDLDQINRWFFDANRDRPLAEILRESGETFDRVERAIAAMSENDLLAADRFPWLKGERLGPAVVHGTAEHFREHEPELRNAAGRPREGGPWGRGGGRDAC